MHELIDILQAVQNGRLSPQQAALQIKTQPFEDLGFAKIDHQRRWRQGAAEVVYGAGKTPAQIITICQHLLAGGAGRVLITRLAPEAAREVEAELTLDYHEQARLAIAGSGEAPPPRGLVAVACGGTSDLPVAEEAALTAEFLGARVERLYDVGVAGLHRLLSRLEVLGQARAVVAAAGMEGALASVVGGLVDCPVVAVPTSVGYGASFNGLAALLAMLNSCASGVSVVNIDNGFGAGYLAALINDGASREGRPDGEGIDSREVKP